MKYTEVLSIASKEILLLNGRFLPVIDIAKPTTLGNWQKSSLSSRHYWEI
ncbi:hypothetical protein FACS1894132_06890 [Clostridia bacterium]|nr:hypothetical protein FACS1894132_06890 [Clostridia bacterium]